MEHKEAGCQAPPEAPVLCINNCGFFGSATTMNMCSKCHRDLILKQQQAKAADSCTASVGNGSFSDSEKEPIAVATANEESGLVEAPTSSMLVTHASASSMSFEKAKESPNRCGACRKRVGLTGFNCRCGNLFCAVHRYSDKHGCPFDYQGAARDALTRANPVIKSEKLDKI